MKFCYNVVTYCTKRKNNLQEYSIEITLQHPDDMMSLFGSNERHLKLIEENLDVIIHARTERVQVLGDSEEAVETARLTIEALLVPRDDCEYFRCCNSLIHGTKWFN